MASAWARGAVAPTTIALVECGELHRRGRARGPKPQRVDVPPAPSRDRRVVRHREHALGGIPQTARGAVRPAAEIFDAAAEPDGIFGFEPLELPRIAERQPSLRQLVLPAVADLLHEQAMLVADAVAVGRHRERRHAVHVAGGEPAEAAVAERRVGLKLAELVEIDVETGERRAGGSQQAKVDQRIEQQASDQEFDGEVVHALAVLALGPLLGFQPAVDHAVADRKDGGEIPVVRAGVRRRRAARIGQLVEDSVAQLRCVRMKRRQREDVRRLWHVPNRNWRRRAGKIQLTFGRDKTAHSLQSAALCQISMSDKVPDSGSDTVAAA